MHQLVAGRREDAEQHQAEVGRFLHRLRDGLEIGGQGAVDANGIGDLGQLLELVDALAQALSTARLFGVAPGILNGDGGLRPQHLHKIGELGIESIGLLAVQVDQADGIFFVDDRHQQRGAHADMRRGLAFEFEVHHDPAASAGYRGGLHGTQPVQLGAFADAQGHAMLGRLGVEQKGAAAIRAGDAQHFLVQLVQDGGNFEGVAQGAAEARQLGGLPNA